ncbi:MAG: DUF1415 domain-containing protein [gamma proteobacterium symbiont of Bathyaustriella thionipta]|nr:DUF1415 domain-containing protein [gamma proteobacterium symbiont of Bathyaustriella thionipta]
MSETIIRQTRQWIEQHVIHLNLCPFARPVYAEERISYKVVEGDDFAVLYQGFLATLLDFVESDPQRNTTGFAIFPDGLHDFGSYLDFVAQCEQALLDAGLQGIVQLASFHPQYCFAQATADDAANYSNRSPWPMLHLLREADMELALSAYKNPEKIPLRNQKQLRKLGTAVLKRRLQDILADSR